MVKIWCLAGMPKPYSMDLRLRVIAAWQAGDTWEDIASRFEIGIATVNRWIGRERRTGSVAPSAHGGGWDHKLDETGLGHLKALVEERSDRTLDELTQLLSERHQIQVSRATVGRGLQRLDFTRKKKG
jgi:transposase